LAAWIDSQELADPKRKIPKDEVLAYVRNNAIQVTEVIKQGPPTEPKYSRYFPQGGERYRELLLTWRPDREIYKSPHWSEPNVIAHVRFDERYDVYGRRVLFIGEIQSDWHQTGRETGYLDDPEEIKRLALKAARSNGVHLAAFEEAFDVASRRGWDVDKAVVSVLEQGLAGSEISVDRVMALAKLSSGIRPAPFAETWHELAFKRMLRWAAENGFDVLGWTTGEQQIKLYGLSNVVSTIRYQKRRNGTYDLTLYDPDGHVLDIPNRRFGLTEQDLRSLCGNVIADSILRGEGREDVSWPVIKEGDSTPKLLENLDFEIGGEGMHEFYDVRLVNFAKKYVRPWGGVVEETEIETPRSSNEAPKRREKIHAIPITLSMKAAVLGEGQAVMEGAAPYGGVVAEPFYSQLLRTIEQKMPDRAPLGQVLNIISGPDVKQEEVQWTGLREWLIEEAKRGPIAKRDVLNFLDENAVRVIPVIYAEDAPDTVKAIHHERERAAAALMNLPNVGSNFIVSLDDFVRKLVTTEATEGIRPSSPEEAIAAYVEKFGSENLPDMNRPEIVRFVSAAMMIGRLTSSTTMYRGYTLAGHESVGYHEVLLIWPRKRGKEEYISPHWSEPNVIVHVRFSDYGDTLLVEEIQSDWHQAARRPRRGISGQKITDAEGKIVRVGYRGPRPEPITELPPGYRVVEYKVRAPYERPRSWAKDIAESILKRSITIPISEKIRGNEEVFKAVRHYVDSHGGNNAYLRAIAFPSGASDPIVQAFGDLSSKSLRRVVSGAKTVMRWINDQFPGFFSDAEIAEYSSIPKDYPQEFDSPIKLPSRAALKRVLSSLTFDQKKILWELPGYSEFSRYLWKYMDANPWPFIEAARAAIPDRFIAFTLGEPVRAWKVVDPNGRPIVGGGYVQPYLDREAAINDALEELNQLALKAWERAPVAGPYQKSWVELAIKFMLRWAAERGYKRLAFTTGEQQLRRYNQQLMQVDSIEWKRSRTGLYHVSVRSKDGKTRTFRSLSPEGLDELLGESLAEQILGSEEKSGRISGTNISIGNLALKRFYDEELPHTINRYVKKWGAKVYRAPLGTVHGGKAVRYFGPDRSLDWIKQLPEVLQSEPIKRVASMMASGMNLRDAMDSLYSESPRDAISVAHVFGGKFTKPKTTSEEVNAIDITPAMRESVMFVGQPVMERQAPYGEIRWRTPTPSEFVAARDRSERIGYLSPLGPDDLAGYRLFLSEDGTVGFSIDPNGDIQNVFNNGGPKRIGGAEAMREAIRAGGRTLDCFDGFLVRLYTQWGFVQVGRMRFNRELAPPGWNFERDGEPDVVFMAWAGYPESEEESYARVLGPSEHWREPQRSSRYFGPDEWDIAKAESRRVAHAGGAKDYRPGGQIERSGVGGAPRPSDLGAGESDRRDLVYGTAGRATAGRAARADHGTQKAARPAAGYADDLHAASALQRQPGVQPERLAGRDEQLAREAVERLSRGVEIARVLGDLPIGGIKTPEGGARLLGLGIAGKILVDKGKVDFSGIRIASANDLARVAQIVRDPTVETVWRFYIKGDVVIGWEAVSSRLPTSSEAFMPGEQPQDVADKMAALGADGFWLLHNHPSGDPRPSRNDIRLTTSLAQQIPGFRGHVIIDSGQYAVIEPDGNYAIEALELGGRDPLFGAMIPHLVLGRAINDSHDLAAAGKEIGETGLVLVYTMLSTNTIRAIEAFGDADVSDLGRMMTHVLDRMRQYGAGRVAAYATTRNAWATAEHLFKLGVLLDAVAEAGAVAPSSPRTSLAMRTGPNIQSPLERIVEPPIRVREEGAPRPPAAAGAPGLWAAPGPRRSARRPSGCAWGNTA
jgi:proteasome lid subunit RPN8/RPN11